MQIKHFVPLLTALALCALAACGGSGDSASASSSEASSAQGQEPTALDRYRGVLFGQDSFLYMDGENAPASLEISQVPALFSPDSSYAAVGAHIFVLDLYDDKVFRTRLTRQYAYDFYFKRRDFRAGEDRLRVALHSRLHLRERHNRLCRDEFPRFFGGRGAGAEG